MTCVVGVVGHVENREKNGVASRRIATEKGKGREGGGGGSTESSEKPQRKVKLRNRAKVESERMDA